MLLQRVEPQLCDHPYTRKRPIFNNSGCQLPGYMHIGAPRCQVKYLKWICDHSRISFDDSRSNGFVIPESDHANSFVPPVPWLLMANDVLVSLCGDVVHACGLVHTQSNCMGLRQRYEAEQFQRGCKFANFRQVK